MFDCTDNDGNRYHGLTHTDCARMASFGIELWRDVEGYEGMYAVSSFGGKRSYERTVTDETGVEHHVRQSQTYPGLGTSGSRYATVSMWDGMYRLSIKAWHLVVMKHFGPPKPHDKDVVNHIDENKGNPHILNLEWVTFRGNALHGTAVERRNQKIGRGCSAHDPETGMMVRAFPSLNEASRFVSDKCGKKKTASNIVSAIKYGNVYGGYVWQDRDTRRKPMKMLIKNLSEAADIIRRCAKFEDESVLRYVLQLIGHTRQNIVRPDCLA